MSSLEVVPSPYWRSLDELEKSPEFDKWIHREFPEQASMLEDSTSRRNFLKLMAASFSLMGLGACTGAPFEKILPYVKAPEDVLAGKAQYFATVLTRRGIGRGVLVESHAGRPTRIEGNPDHPQSLGSTDPQMTAEILSLYDPDRSKVPRLAGTQKSWTDFNLAWIAQVTKHPDGEGLRVLSENFSSPLLVEKRTQFLRRFPKAKWVVHETLYPRNEAAATAQLFGQRLQPHFDFAKADVVLAVQGDFMGEDIAGLKHARAFANLRRVGRDKNTMNRLYAVESTLSQTGAMADHRFPLSARSCERWLLRLAAELNVATVPRTLEYSTAELKWIHAVAKDLLQHAGRCLVYVGATATPELQMLGFAINEKLKNLGTTLTFSLPSDVGEDAQYAIPQLQKDMASGLVQAIICIGTNPVYTVAGGDFAANLAKVPFKVHYGSHFDETAHRSDWHLPAAHSLEAWGDSCATDGTASLQQPLIRPLYQGKSTNELLGQLLGLSTSDYQDLRTHWLTKNAGVKKVGTLAEGNSDEAWNGWLKSGIITKAYARTDPEFHRPVVAKAAETIYAHGSNTTGLELHFHADPHLDDGRMANNGWMQELPKPFNSICWGNAALISPADAKKFKLESKDIVKLTVGNRSVEIPVWVQAGVAPNAIILHIGHGRKNAGQVGDNVGTDVNILRNANFDSVVVGAKLEKTTRKGRITTTQHHQSVEGRDIIHSESISEYKFEKSAAEVAAEKAHATTLMPSKPLSEYAWGMTVDLNVCTNCKACVVGCQSENNSPVVGFEEVDRGREMHWLRVDTYFKGDPQNPETYSQPVPCMHCESAPCEVVCPVAATVHDSEGLNDMIYNRCVGTRYCSNNCPYKVRRFNFLQYQDTDTAVLKLMRNPNVTVRSRGVMEKCTYCVQRINLAHQNSEVQNRKIRDGEIKTACQQACPVDAIAFGNIRDPQSQVSRLKAEPQNYSLLEELGTKPRTTYLGKFRNQNPELS